MMEISGPRRNAEYPDRALECEEALEPAFLNMMACALKTGWADVETATAVIRLAENYILSRQANAETDAAIVSAARRQPT